MTKADKDTIYVLCCGFFWNALCEVKKRFDEDVEESKVYIAEIAEIIKPLKPILIYIDKANVKAAKGSMFDYEDSMQSLVERRARELQILWELKFDSYTISQDILVGSLRSFVFLPDGILLP